MAEEAKMKPNEMPELTDPRGCEAIWVVDHQQGTDMHATMDTMAAYAASKVDFSSTNAKVDQVGQVVAALGSPLQSGGTVHLDATEAAPVPVKPIGTTTVTFASVPTVHLDNPTTFPSSMAVTGTVNVGNQQPYPTTMAVTGNVGIIGSPAFTLAPSALPLPILAPAPRAAWSGAMYAAMVGPTNLAATAGVIGMLVNPLGSAKTLYVDAVALGAGLNAYVTRGRLATAPTTGLGTAATPTTNTLGATSAPAGRFYSGSTAGAGTPERGSFVAGGSTEVVAVDGRLAIPPNSAVVWSAQATGSLSLLTGLLLQATLSVTWWEA